MTKNPLSTPAFGEIGTLSVVIVNGDGTKVTATSIPSSPEIK